MTQPPDPLPQSLPPTSVEKGSWFGALIFYLFLWGLGSTVAIIGGLFLAVFYPRLNPPKPLVMRGWEAWRQQSKLSVSTGGVEQVQLQQQIQEIQTQFQKLQDQTAQLESQLELQNQAQPLETRLQLLQAESSKLAQTSAPNGVQFVSPIGQLKVTLPSTLLFAESSDRLGTNANRILETIVEDLRQHPGSTIRITAHTDEKTSEEENRELSFQHARAIATYLDNILEGNYRWVIIGYGSTRPLERLSRRVEISID